MHICNILQVLEGHTDEIFSCAFNYEGDTIITGIILWTQKVESHGPYGYAGRKLLYASE